ncbi:hypothetical protein JCM11251_003854 [Rhodosporidiobolus azoricus]
MGQAESHPSSSTTVDPALRSLSAAFHVLRVAESSPAAEAGVDPFFDFIVGAEGQQLGDEIDLLTDVLERSEGRQISLQVYSTKRREVRDVHVTPSRDWSADGAPGGEVDGQPSLLGLSLRLCNPQHALEQVWHVLEILEGSPAQSAGLVPFGDWIVGYAGGVLRGEGDFYDVVEAHVDKPLRLFVYNADYDVTREAILVPNRSWGGEGLLGCGVGYGLLHRIPKPQDRAPGATTGYQVPPPPQAQPPRQQTPDRSDRLASFSSSGPLSPSKNPLYAPPPPRATPPRATPPPPPRSSVPPPPRATPPRAPVMVAPPPPRRTAALASYDEEEDDTPDVPSRAQPQHDHSHDQSYDHSYDQSYTSHPSFSHYSHDNSYSSDNPYGGAYDASEGVEVVAVSADDNDEGDFVSAPRQSQESYRGQGGYSPYRGGGGAGAGGYGGRGGVATVIAEEAD